MKTKILSTIALLFGLFMTAKAQNNNWNYVHTRTMLTATADSYMDNVVYYDGLGRPFQNAQLHAAPNGQSIVDFTEYDASGRVWRQWNKAYTAGEFMPYEGISLSYPYIYNDSRCYAETVYDGSPLDRVTKQYGPGNAWSSHPVQTDYMVNNGTTAELKCLYYSVNTDGTLNANNGASYPTGSLHVVKTTDEDGNVGYVFTDKQGRTLLERRMNGAVAHDTYYVYDVYSNLCFVLQPMYQDSNNVDLFAFQYKYDHRNRCIWKKLPGTGYVEYVYNNADQLTYSQDGNQRTNGQWTYYVYDNLNRLTEQGLSYGKTTSGTVMVKNYYDDYSFVTAESLGGYYVQGTEPANGLLTASVITTEGGSGEKVYYAYYYDEKGRLVKTVHTPLRGGIYLANTSYTFTDKPLQEQRIYFHGESGVAPIVEYIDYSYDSSDRLQKITHQRMGVSGLAAVELVSYTYDNLGRMSAQSFHNGGYNNTYGYNVRGWLTNIGGNNFMQSLTYNNGTTGFNGNITAMNWTANGSSHSYSFTYDGMNRMQNATHGTGAYTEKVTSYDKNGNILALQRYGNGLIDNLAYTYNGNRLTQVEDATGNASGFKNGASQANEYTYDNNGNLTKDSNKGIASITYNSLNLPKKITYSDGGSVTYLYGADGKKYRTIHVIGGVTTTTEYIGNLVYVNNTPQKMLTEVGYMDLTDNTYYYYQKDHQGNNRVVINGSGTVVETNHYYPFGGVFASSTNVQPYKYNGKELDTKNGLNWYDYGARHYDAALGRWHVVDPLAEKYHSTSPYAYCLNNPVKYVDPTGCFASTHTDSLGNVIAVFNDGDLGVYRHDTDADGVEQLLINDYSNTNTSAGGERMGETYEWDSFVNPESKDPIGQIDFGSFVASQKVFSSLRMLTKIAPNSVKLLIYALNANNGEMFDVKSSNPYFGSQFGVKKYVSMRDAGNILAGLLARSSGLSANVTYTAFGALQLSGNNRALLPLYLYKAWNMRTNGSYGETPISHSFQKRGYELNF